MKNAIRNLTDGLLALLFLSIGLLTIHALAGCSPRLSDQIINAPAPIVVIDTVEIVSQRTVTDTVLLAGEQVPYFDSTLCPPGLLEPTYVYETDTFWMPARRVPVTLTVHDTIRVPQYVQAPGVTITKDVGWPERITWLCGLLALLVPLWKKWKEEQPATT